MEQSGHALGNLGDWAMLQVAIKRCRSVFPGCEIQVFGKDIDRLRQCIPDVTPVPWAGQPYLLGDGPILGRLGKSFCDLDRAFVRTWPRMAMPLVQFRHRICGHDVRDLDSLIDHLLEADLVVASGGGFITDEFPDMVEGVCSILRIAQRLGKPTAMFGQGLGPLQNMSLRRTASSSLQNLRVISLREGLSSPRVALSLGVTHGKMTVTGDDAVETAFIARPASPGSRLGINVRVARYSSMDNTDLQSIRQAMKRIVDELRTVVQVLPILIDEDRTSTEMILPAGCEQHDSTVHTPDDIIRLAGQCRLVITGSYHAGVFALSQGIPVLALAKSSYYAHKFEGLAEQFGTGCKTLQTNSPEFSNTFFDTAMQMWQDADQYREELLARAESQIKRSIAAYTRFAENIR